MSFDKYTETEPYESGFAQFYEDSILPHLHVLMEKRSKVHRETKRRNVLASLGSFAIAGATGAFGFFFDNIPGVLWSVVGAAIAGAVSSMWIWAGRPAIEFRADAKRHIFADILAFFGCKHLIDKQDLYPIHSNLITAKIFKFYTKVEIDDAFIITRQGRQISFAEVTLKFEKEKNADKVVFQGLFMCMEMREPLDNIAVRKSVV